MGLDHFASCHASIAPWISAHAALRACCMKIEMRAIEEEEEGFYKFLPANTADRLCQLWQSCSNHHEI